MFNYLRQSTKKASYTDEYPDDYFAINISIMKIAAIWNPKKPFSIFVFIFCIIFCTPSEFVSLWSTRPKINEFTMNAGVALTHGVAAVKMINWYIRRKRILGIMAMLNSNNLKYDNWQHFLPGLIVQKAKRTNITVSAWFYWCAIMVPISGYIAGFANFLINPNSFYFDVEENVFNSTKEFKCVSLPFFSWIPFPHSTEKTCILAMIFQSFPMLYLTLIIVAVDTLFMSLINYLTAHLKVLQGALRTIIGRSFEKSKFKEQIHVDIVTMQEMKKCLKHLQTIQDLSRSVEDTYSMQMLCQVLVSVFVLCTCLFLISTEPIMSKTFIVEVVYVLAIEYQLTLYCWFGNELTLASMGINDALYESNWISASQTFKKCMIITMIRMRKPIYVTVAKFTPLTVETLQTILRGSYSLYAVLKNRNST